MIVRKFLQWTATASADMRSEGAAALAQAYADQEFDAVEDREAEAAMTALLDDPAPIVRHALAVALAASARAPHALVTALAADRSDIAALVLEFSPVLTAPELIDAVAVGDDVVQGAVARRAGLPVGLAAALAEVAGASACIELCRNETASIPDSALGRMMERFGQDGDVRAAIAERQDLSPALRFDLVTETARSLAAFVTAKGWLGAERAARTTREAADQACVAIAADTHDRAGMRGLAALVQHLRRTGCLTPALILRAVLCGNRTLFEAAVSDLAGVPLHRVAGLMRTGQGLGFQSLYAKAGLPAALRPAFVAALQQAGSGTGADGTSLQRGRIGKVLEACRDTKLGDLGSVTALLRRLDAQAARDEARSYAREVMGQSPMLRLPWSSAVDCTLPLSSAA